MKAFPQTRLTINGERDFTSADLGMDLRDYFAAAALQGLISKGYSSAVKADEYALSSYEAADAMMKAREPK